MAGFDTFDTDVGGREGGLTADVSEACGRIHAAVARLPPCTQPLQVPFESGLYFFFEKGEESTHGPEGRIVRVGKNKSRSLQQRLRQHFGTQKNSSVFRKYVGGALIRRRDPGAGCLAPGPGKGHWERQDEHKCSMCEPVEGSVSEYLHKHTNFRCVRIHESDERSEFERVLIATIAQCPLCVASPTWLGRDAYSIKVQRTGLWNSDYTGGQTISAQDLRRFEDLAAVTPSLPPSIASVFGGDSTPLDDDEIRRQELSGERHYAMLAVVRRVVSALIDSIAALDDGFEHREPDDGLSRILVALQNVLDVIDPPEPFYHLQRDSPRAILRRIKAARRGHGGGESTGGPERSGD